MTRTVCTGALAVVVGLWAGAGRAPAQSPGPPRLGAPPPPPGSSPYLNLLRGGNPAINYYGLVRPQQNFQTAIQTLQAQQQAALPPAPTGPAEDPGLPGTGVAVGFLNHHVYFMSLGGPGGAAFGGLGTGTVTRASPIGAGLQAPARPAAPRGR
jgi:hypothetical protein